MDRRVDLSLAPEQNYRYEKSAWEGRKVLVKVIEMDMDMGIWRCIGISKYKGVV